MASLRQKESKVPLRIDSKLKHISKIPLRVEAKPEIFAEPEIKRTNTVAQKKAAINTLDRKKGFAAVIPKKEEKPVSLQIKSKSKENRFQKSEKISLNRASKANTNKSSNHVSQVLKDRNKIGTKELPNKLKPVNNTEDPFSKFKKRTPKITIEDYNLFKTSNDEEQMKNPSQKDIEFVADESMKNFILSNRQLTPSMLKSSSKIKISSVVERPSMYKKFNYSTDPYKQAFADIQNYDLASERRRISEMQKNGIHLSPFQNRNSLYKPIKCAGNPYQDALKSIAKLRLNQNVKSCKKVTFKISGEDVINTDQSSGPEHKEENHKEKPVVSIQANLSILRENGSESSKLPSPEFESKMIPLDSSPTKKVTVEPYLIPEVFEKQNSDAFFPEENYKQTTDYINNRILSTSPIKAATIGGKCVKDLIPTSCIKQKSGENAAIFNHENRNSILKNVNPFFNSMRTLEKQMIFSNQSGCLIDKRSSKIFTPRAVSFFPELQLTESFSPEFLSTRTTDILSCAPINTPLVLKSLSKYELNPVCKKLEFKDSPKELNKACNSRESSQTFNLQNILTQQKILDQLAHQECSIFMHETSFPCEIRKYLQNPVAQILNNGDDMHFVPVSLP